MQSVLRKNIREQFDRFVAYAPHGTKTRVERLHKFLASRCDKIGQSTLEGHIVASGIVTDGHSILLIKHRVLAQWLQPGGHINSDDDCPENGAIREVLEETGLRVCLSDWHTKHHFPFDIDIHMIPSRPTSGEQQHLHFDYRYLFNHSVTTISTTSPEVTDSGWFPLEQAAVLAPGLKRALWVAKKQALIS